MIYTNPNEKIVNSVINGIGWVYLVRRKLSDGSEQFDIVFEGRHTVVSKLRAERIFKILRKLVEVK